MLKTLKIAAVGATALLLASCASMNVSPLQSVYVGCEAIYSSLSYLTRVYQAGGLSKGQVDSANQVIAAVHPVCFSKEYPDETSENLKIVEDAILNLLAVRKEIKGA